MRRILLVSVLLILPSAAALADAPDVKKMATDDCAKARKANKTCVISIEGIDVEGNAGKGNGERINVPGFTEHASLIRIRRDFIPEILKSAEHI